MDFYEDEQVNRSRDQNWGETEGEVVVRASHDPATGDLRALHNLRALETCSHVSASFNTIQTDIQPHMRRILAVWMFQVGIRH